MWPRGVSSTCPMLNAFPTQLWEHPQQPWGVLFSAAHSGMGWLSMLSQLTITRTTFFFLFFLLQFSLGFLLLLSVLPLTLYLRSLSSLQQPCKVGPFTEDSLGASAFRLHCTGASGTVFLHCVSTPSASAPYRTNPNLSACILSTDPLPQ